MKKSPLYLLCLILLVIGGLNWGLVGVANLNLVSAIFKDGMLANIVYMAVGVSALYVAIAHMKK